MLTSKFKKIFFAFGLVVIVFCVFVAVCDVMVSRDASGKTYDDVESIPHRKVGLRQSGSMQRLRASVVHGGVTVDAKCLHE